MDDKFHQKFHILVCWFCECIRRQMYSASREDHACDRFCQTPNTGLRHSSAGKCRKAMIGVCVFVWPRHIYRHIPSLEDLSPLFSGGQKRLKASSQSWHRIVPTQLCSTQHSNPIIAPACKIFGLKDATDAPANRIFSGPVTSIFNATRSDENLFTCQCEEENKKA